MNRLKRFAIGTSLILAVLGAAVPLWYQSHYRIPIDSPVKAAIPEPNGYDTLKEATELLTPLNLRYITSLTQPLAARQKLLAANQATIAKIRVGLQQEYFISEAGRIELEVDNAQLYYELATLLELAAYTHADQGNLSEAMRCSLDSVEFGMRLPHGGDMSVLQAGRYGESLGYLSAWKLADRVDAKTARQAATRLAQLEEQRWPAIENLRENFRITRINFYQYRYEKGPVALWKELDPGPANLGTRLERAQYFWERIKTVYGGPKAFLDYTQVSVRNLEELSKLPWGPQRQQLPDPGVPLGTFESGDFSYLEFQERTYRTHASLLHTYLMLRAYQLDHGSYPDSLETLVASGDLKAVPVDLFSPTSAPLCYRKNVDGTITLWSVGPDAKDNNGRTILGDTWRAEKSGYLPGDIVARVTTYPLYWQ